MYTQNHCLMSFAAESNPSHQGKGLRSSWPTAAQQGRMLARVPSAQMQRPRGALLRVQCDHKQPCIIYLMAWVPARCVQRTEVSTC